MESWQALHSKHISGANMGKSQRMSRSLIHTDSDLTKVYRIRIKKTLTCQRAESEHCSRLFS